MSLFTRKHRHQFETRFIYSGAANTAKWVECECGERTQPELTPAGLQQVGWWMQIFPEWEYATIIHGVENGTLPYPFVWTGAQPDGSLGRLLTRDEALGLMAA